MVLQRSLTLLLLLGLVPVNFLVPGVIFQDSTALAQNRPDRNVELRQLLEMGNQLYRQGNLREAFATYQHALEMARDIGNRFLEGTSLTNLGAVQQAWGQYAKALAFYEQALVICQQEGNRPGEAKALNDIGSVNYSLAQYPKALEFYQRALAIQRQMGDVAGEGVTLSNMGLVFQGLGQYSLALDVYVQSLAIRRQLGDRVGEGATLNNMGLVFYYRSQYSKALEFYQQSLALRKQMGDRDGEGATLNNMGLVYQSLSQYPEALEVYQQALAIRKQMGNRAGEGTTLHNIGAVHHSLSQYAKALEFYQQSLKIRQQVSDRAGEGTTLDNIGTVYASLGQAQKALKLHQQSLVLRQQIGDRAGEATSLNNLGTTYQSLGLYSQALESHQKVLAIVTELDDVAGKGTSLINIGAVYSRLGQYPKALEFYQKSLALRKLVGDRVGEGRTLTNMGALYTSLGDYPKAEAYLKQALTIHRQVGDRGEAGKTLTNLGYLYLRWGKAKAAEETYRTALQVQESLRPGLTDESKIALFETLKNIYVHLQQALVAQNKSNEALEIAERGRARAFADLLAQRLGGRDRALAINNQSLMQSPSTEQIRQIAKVQNATLVQYSIIYRESRQGAKRTWQDESLYIWVIKPTGEIVFRQVPLQTEMPTTAIAQSPPTPSAQRGMDLERSNLMTLVNNTQRSLGIRRADSSSKPVPTLSFQADPSRANIQLRQLHQLLIAPIADLLPTDPNQRVIFIPQDVLFLVPFPALRDANGSLLIEKHTILTAPSIQVLALTRQQQQRLANRKRPIGNALIVGNPTMPQVASEPDAPAEPLSPLPAAEVEAQTIAQLLNVPVLTGDRATKAAVVQQMSTAPLIHLATHGLLDNERGLGSAIALAPSNRDSGFLTAEDILGMELSADLVVLSACDTGRGRLTGDGVIGLSRSLISAGVPSVVVSLWSVSDVSTAMLMTEFYRHLQQGSDKAQALRQAMLKTRQIYRNPIDWAAFTLIGEAN